MTARKLIPVVIGLCMAITPVAQGAQPLDSLQGPIEEVLSILKAPQYQDVAQKDQQREEIRGIVQKAFDFAETSKRTLGRHWKSFTPQEREEFTHVFTELLGRIYIDKMTSEYQEVKVVYLGQKMLTDSRAVVKTKILRNDAEIPADYGMLSRNGTWKIYDVKIEGVSLVKNYRSQFKQILFKESPAQLIERLKKKVGE
jgi:phospholipid transport system substrate-binding protein